MMKSTLEMVKEFHKAFVRHQSPEELQKLRIRLLREELDELEKALQENNRVEVLDALTDLQYVLDGAYIAFGLDHVKDIAFVEVHRSNMTKLGPDGKPVYRSDGKIIKGPNFSPPNLKPFIYDTEANMHPVQKRD